MQVRVMVGNGQVRLDCLEVPFSPRPRKLDSTEPAKIARDYAAAREAKDADRLRSPCRHRPWLQWILSSTPTVKAI